MIHHLTAIWRFRHFLLALVRLDLRLRYRRSVLGIGWSLLNPLAMTAVFVVVFSGPLGGGQASDYASSLLLGLAVWNFFREAASRSRSISSLDIRTAGLFFSSSFILSKISLSFVSRSSGVFGCSSGLGGSQTNCSQTGSGLERCRFQS